MVKVLSQAGISLADTYDVEGSIAGIEQLQSEDVQLVHEMGGTIFSERLSGTVRRRTTGAVLQSTAWDQLITDLPVVPFRIAAVAVIADVSGRTSIASIAVRDPISGREVPIWLWDTTTDLFNDIRIDDDGAGAANIQYLLPTNRTFYPLTGIGTGQPQSVPDLAFRGSTTGFGAGDVTHTALIYIEFAAIGGISSQGLPVPGW